MLYYLFLIIIFFIIIEFIMYFILGIPLNTPCNDIYKYNKILYIDTDILLNSDINVLFNLNISSS